MTVASNAIGAIRNWWWFIIVGLLFIVSGIAVLSRPLEGYVSLSVLFSIAILGIGISQIVFAIGNKDILPGWGWTLASGIIDVAVGAYLFMFPVVTMATLPYFVGFWLMFRSFYIMGASMDIQSFGISGWGWLFSGGILLLILSGLILYFPTAAAVGIVAWSGLAFLTGGLLSIVLAFKLRGIKNAVKMLA
ncbi:HdeD family acid-resistance protein [Puia dinghuensis]|uniref:Membrane protein n=1 Tax=Puia dinghuensis TaxID=1792502 RepID=A0A8J2UDG9_9BACT|nr:DUF308 domain-containing protein [Puia dinghuensis]GGB02439.1 membrane protein [Puia dinghuensis]